MGDHVDVEVMPETEPIRKRRPFTGDEIKRVLDEAEVVADIVRRIDAEFFSLNPRWNALLETLSPDEREVLRELFDEHHDRVRRRFEPWPEWVWRIAAELCSVQFPTIPKSRIKEVFRFIHFFVFEMRLKGPRPQEPLRFPDVDATLLGSLLGHLVARMERERVEVERLVGSKDMSAEERAKYLARIAAASDLSKVNGPLADCLNTYPGFLVPFSEALAKAKTNTFDKHGNTKETSLSAIYQAIFEEWPAVEMMSGPTQLCEYLGPLLHGSGNDPEMRLDRVKKICRRMGIVFRGTRKGTKPHIALSLPQKT